MKKPVQKTEQIPFRLDPKRAQEMRDWAHKRHIKVQAMVEIALKELMDAGMPTVEGRQRLLAKPATKAKKSAPTETELAYTLHNVYCQEWVDRVILVFNSNNSGAMEALAGNLVGFLAALSGLQLRGRLVDIINGSNTEDAADYAAAAEAAQDSFEQFRRLLEGMRSPRARWQSLYSTRRG